MPCYTLLCQSIRTVIHFISRTPGQVRQLMALTAFVLIALPANADVAAPQEAPKAKLLGDVAQSSGAYTKTIPISVPAFRGLEPELTLTYSSLADSGFAGVGWNIGGLSFIERASPGRGAPRYDASDIYLLDGEELVASCTTFGGTHCLQHQTYQRISFNSGTNQWTIWDKNGTKNTYNALYTVASGTFRWALATEIDVHGNTVTYSYWCETSANCYPDTITYNGATITFHRESRPTTDIIPFANGNTVLNTNYRLRSIGVKVGTNYARAYGLTYTDSTATRRSLLASVQVFGTDVTISGAGVPSGTSLPATTMVYVAGGSQTNMTPATNNPSVTLPLHTSCISGDYNQDGNSSDLACYVGSGDWWIWLSSPDAWVWGGVRSNFSTDTDVTDKCVSGDFNRDGMTDVACYAGSGTWRVGVSTGGNATSTSTWTMQNWTGGPTTDGHLVRNRCFVGDYNGDGRSDIACHNAGAWRIGLSSGSSWSNPNTIWTGPSVDNTAPVTNTCLSADYNGDGKTDLSCQTGSSTALWATYLANAAGNNFTNAGNWSGPAPALPVSNQCLTADLNGDGKAEMTCYTLNSGSWHSVLSSGNAFVAGAFWNNGPTPNGHAGTQCAARDTNGDNRTDISCITNTSGGWTTSHSLGNGWQTAQSWTSTPLPGAWRDRCVINDFNGDGLADFTCRTSSSTWQVAFPKGSAGHPDLLQEVTNGFGGKETVVYAPSSRWANYNTSASWLNLYDVPVGTVWPTVKETTLNDGRGVSETTAHRYEFAKWSYALKASFGFARADMHPASGVCLVTRFRQTDASPGSMEEYAVYENASSTQPLQKLTRSFTETQTAPYTSLVTQENDTEQNGQTSSRTSRKVYAYDTYGNVELVYDYGDIDATITADDKTIYSVHYPNTTTYVVDKPGFVNTYAGIGTGGAIIAQTLYHYDNNTYYYNTPTKGSLTKQSDWDNQLGGTNADTSIAYNNTLFGYDTYGNVTSVTDPEGRVTATTYNDTTNTTYNNVYAIKVCSDPSGLNQCVTKKWNLALGMPIEATDANNALVKMSYDAMGRKSFETDPADNVTSWSYLDWGNPTLQRVRTKSADGSAWDPNGGVGVYWTDSYMDGLGRPWKVEKENTYDEVWNGQQWVYTIKSYVQQTVYKDASLKIWKQSHWYDSTGTPVYTVYDYDKSDRLTKVTHPDGSTITHSFLIDASGKPYVKTVSEMGQEIAQWHDANGRLVKVQEKDGATVHTTTYEYDRLGNRTKTTDANNNITTSTYDSLGRRLTNVRVGGATWVWTYFKDGKVKTEKDAKLQVTSFTYDSINRMKTKTAGVETTTWYYDEAGYGSSKGRLTRIVYPGGSKEFKYDIRGLVIWNYICVDTVCKTFTTDYDVAGREQQLVYPDGEGVIHTYNAAGHLYSLSNYVTAMTWGPAGQLLSMTYANGTTNSYVYDTNREWLSSATAKLGATTLYTASYGYDLSARITSMTHGTPTAVSNTYTYDSLNRLKEIKNSGGTVIQSYTYDAIGNITNNSLVGSYTYHPTHKHAVEWAANSRNYNYDLNGSMVSAAGNGPSLIMSWDAENRMTSLNRDGVVTTFAYDEDEQRVKKTTGSNVTRYFSPTLERVNTSDIQYYYADGILVAKKEAGVKSWYHADRLSSTRLMTNASGAEIKDYDYRAFGSTLSSSGTASNERGYTGHITDGESSLVYMGGRYYDATLSRFISADDIIPDPENPQAYNRYSYVYNNPLNHTDPSGHVPVPAIAIAISAVASALASGAAAKLSGAGMVEVMLSAAIGAVSGGAGGAGTLAVRKMVKKRLLKATGELDDWGRKKVKQQGERASILLFGITQSSGAAGIAAARGERGLELYAAFAMGAAGGHFGAFTRGLYYKRKFGSRMTHGDVIRRVAAKNLGVPAHEINSTTITAAFRSTKGGLFASFIVGSLSRLGANVSLKSLRRGHWSDALSSIRLREKAINNGLHDYAYDTGRKCRSTGKACFSEEETKAWRRMRKELRQWEDAFQDIRKMR
jgi:RHS repeat-associated protein